MARGFVQPPPAFAPVGVEGAEAVASRRRRVCDYQLFEGGAGTPWDNRGGEGPVRAFFQTCWMSLRCPARLFDLVRRGDGTRDAVGFVLACGVAWGVGWNLIEIATFLHRSRQDDVEAVNTWLFVVNCALRLVVAPAALLLLVNLAARLWQRVVSPAAVGAEAFAGTFNLLAYALGPSVLALVPVVGPTAALVWILALITTAGVRRHRLPLGNALLGGVVGVFAGAAVAAGLYVSVGRAWEKTMSPTIELKKPVDAAGKVRVG